MCVLVLLASACGGGAPSSISPTDAPASDISPFPGSSSSSSQTVEPSAGVDTGTLTGTVQAGEIAGSATVDPFEAAVIEATGPDGSTYSLAIEPASVRHPTVVSLRPLTSVSFDGATLLAGVEIEPSGLQLFVPAVLTIIPAAAAGATPTAGTTTPTTMEYTGPSDATIARIASVTPSSSAAGYQLVLTHFSGGIVTNLTPDTETSLFEAFSASHDLPNTPDGRQARAETGLRTIKWAEDHGRVEHDYATERTADYEREWWAAEADRVRDDPVLNTKIRDGNPADADAISTEVARMLEAAKHVQDSGGDATTAFIEATGLAAEYGTNLANNLRSDPAFQATLKSGLVSDVAAITDMLGILAGLARQAALLGNDEAAQAMIQAWKDFLETMTTAIASTCSQAPITPQMAYGLTRQAALLGQEAAMAALEDCLPTPPPCPQAINPGLAMTGAAFVSGGAIAAGDVCAPLGYAFAGGWPDPYGNHSLLPLGAVSCSSDLLGLWAVLSLADLRVLKLDSLIAEMNDPSNRIFVSRVLAGDPFEVTYEFAFGGVLTPSEGPPATVRLDVTDPYHNNRHIYDHVYELSPVTGSTMPNVCSTG